MEEIPSKARTLGVLYHIQEYIEEDREAFEEGNGMFSAETKVLVRDEMCALIREIGALEKYAEPYMNLY